jgi:hypothetical protein
MKMGILDGGRLTKIIIKIGPKMQAGFSRKMKSLKGTLTLVSLKWQSKEPSVVGGVAVDGVVVIVLDEGICYGGHC